MMMKVIVGCLVGLCPVDGIDLMREYLHIHRLAYYSVHTEDSIEWLESAVESFSSKLRDPAGPFVKEELIANGGDYEPQRLHYFRHYAHAIREWGAMLSFSTDRTEIWHKPLKAAYARTNKVEATATKQILLQYTTLTSFQNMIDNFDAMLPTDAEIDRDPVPDSAERHGDDFEGRDLTEIPPQAPAGITSITWPKHPRSGWKTVSAVATQEQLQLCGFTAALSRYFRDRSVSPRSKILINRMT